MLGITRQKYYRSNWSIGKSKDVATQVVELVELERMLMPRIGTCKLYHILYNKLRDLNVGRDKFFTILKANHLLISPKRSYHITTNSHHRFKKHKNIIENMPIIRPEQVWVSDITYIGNRNNNMYLALITDAYSKKIVGYDLSSSLSAEGSLRALNMANKNRIYPHEELIHHSDRGVQYCSDTYQSMLEKFKINVSMTETYDPYANAIAERVNGILKQEFLLEQYNMTLDNMSLLVRDAIKTYNERRPHLSCWYLTPKDMHSQRSHKIRTYKKNSINTASCIDAI